MDIEVKGEDKFGAAAYESLFVEIMSDIGKAFQMEKADLILKPDVPLFIISIKLRAEPTNRKISDVANIRTEGGMIHLTVSDERYAPNILKELWKKYGKDGVDQQTRFDMEIKSASEKDIASIVVASEEEYLKEIIGAIWRSMPEGIKNRHTYIDGSVITVVATEEIFQPEMLKEGQALHKKMLGGGKNV